MPYKTCVTVLKVKFSWQNLMFVGTLYLVSIKDIKMMVVLYCCKVIQVKLEENLVIFIFLVVFSLLVMLEIISCDMNRVRTGGSGRDKQEDWVM